ncbi:MAG: NADH-quinone oxidoreductase subunit M [Caedibacter sp. 38-128]|nr:NADH-quinone oxidoreductase subunit M [Holosporales bacterium]OJX03537.1 MAG: NADH-quinone oxidoreductase subunit M [Caedibacter sp. 38-128]
MEQLPLLTLMIFLPLLGAFAILLIKNDPLSASQNARGVALLTSLTTFVLSLVVLSYFKLSSSDFQLVEKYEWVPKLSLNYCVGVDGISLLFILLTTFLTPIAILASWNVIRDKVKEYMITFLMLESLIIGSFCALDLVLFYIFFEAVLIPMYLIIGIWGGKARIHAAFKFFLFTLSGSVLMLIAILSIHGEVGTTDLVEAYRYTFSGAKQYWLWAAFFISFAVKIPMWPVHTWLPNAHVEAPTAGSVILAAILLKMGGYGFLRFSLPLFPEPSQFFAPYVFGLSMIAVVYASLVALVQEDMKKLVAYSSIAHMGFVTFGIFTFTEQGIKGAFFQMISHGIISAGLFLCVGILYSRVHSREIMRYAGVRSRMPHFAFMFLICVLASIGLPGTSGFVGELLVLVASFEKGGWMTLIMGSGIVLSAAYGLWLYKRIMLGKLTDKSLEKLNDIIFIEKLYLLPIVAVILLLGIYPKPIFMLSETAIERVIAPFYTELKPEGQL